MNGADARGRRRRRWVVIVAGVVVLAGGVALVAETVDGDDADKGSTGAGSATSLATVERRSLSTQTQFNATFGICRLRSRACSGARNRHLAAGGRAGGPPGAGAVPDGTARSCCCAAPPGLAHSRRTDDRRGVTGVDVAQLNHDLVALGYVDRADVHPGVISAGSPRSGWKSCSTISAVADRRGRSNSATWYSCRTAAGDRAGRRPRRRGTRAVLSATSTADGECRTGRRRAAEVTAGDRVTITLPGGTAVHGRVPRWAGWRPRGAGRGPKIGPTVPVALRPERQRARRPGSGAGDGGRHRPDGRGALAYRWTRCWRWPAGATRWRSPAGAHHRGARDAGVVRRRRGPGAGLGTGLAAGQRVVVPPAQGWPAAGGPCWSSMGVSKTYPGAPPVTALRGQPDRGRGRAGGGRGPVRARASPRCCT